MTFKDKLLENLKFKATNEKDDPCWDSHKQIGMKKKGGKEVPNCVPKEEVEVVQELTAAEKKLVNTMYDKKGNLTPLGKKVMNHGKKQGDKGFVESVKAPYEIYHKDFSGAMQHAYASAKKNYGITVKPSEIDDKVASGPRKPGNGKTNSYRLKGDRGAIQVQVYNMGSKYELNMYKESLDENLKLINRIKNSGVVKTGSMSKDTPAKKKAEAERRKEYNAYQKSKR